MLQKYQIRFLLTAIVFFLFLACSEEVKQAKPILDETTMVKVIAALFIAEVNAIDTYELSIQKDQFIKNYIYPAVFDSLKVSDSLFYNAYDYYDDNPKAFNLLMDKVITFIDSTKVDSIPNDNPKKKPLDQVYKEIHDLENIKKIKSKRGNNE